MKLSTVFSTTALAVLLGISAPALIYAQDESHPRDEKRAEPDDRAAHEQDKQDDKRVDHDKENKENKENRAPEGRRADQEGNSARPQERREANQQTERREGNEHRRIPDDRFRANFGREHTFRVGRPVIVEGVPRFQYGGYWFVIAQPWPVGWGYDDQVYVDYIDGGYFLLSPVRPGVQLSINVVF